MQCVERQHGEHHIAAARARARVRHAPIVRSIVCRSVSSVAYGGAPVRTSSSWYARAHPRQYLRVQYGQRRPLEPGKSIQVSDGQIVDNVDVSMPRMGIITGRITDENNEPIEGVNVYALRSMYFNGRRQFVPTGANQVRTDDDGSYRLRSLAPGTYLVRPRRGRHGRRITAASPR